MRHPNINKRKSWHWTFISVHCVYAIIEFAHGGITAIAASCAAIAVAIDALFAHDA